MSATLSPSVRIVLRLAPHRGGLFLEDSVGRYAVALWSGVHGQLEYPDKDAAATGPVRSELASIAIWTWDPAYELPVENCQWEILGERWNVVPGQVRKQTDRAGRLLYRQCDLVRAV